MQSKLQAAYLLHGKAYRETSVLADFFTLAEGRISVVARGIRRPRSPQRGLLQPFVPLWIHYTGKHDLMSLKNVEARAPAHYLAGKYSWSGLYLNELLVRLLQRFDPHAALFNSYAETLQQLSVYSQKEEKPSEESLLRKFEFLLLKELGYGLEFRKDNKGKSLNEDALYTFNSEEGFSHVLSEKKITALSQKYFLGAHLLAMHQEDFSQSEILQTAKRLMRLAFAPLLGAKPLMSRTLWRQYAPQ